VVDSWLFWGAVMALLLIYWEVSANTKKHKLEVVYFSIPGYVQVVGSFLFWGAVIALLLNYREVRARTIEMQSIFFYDNNEMIFSEHIYMHITISADTLEIFSLYGAAADLLGGVCKSSRADESGCHVYQY
jgi:hypothetical protein